jgi:hypothetical protein
MAPPCNTTGNQSTALSAPLHETLNTWHHRTSQHHAVANQLFLTPFDTTVPFTALALPQPLCMYARSSLGAKLFKKSENVYDAETFAHYPEDQNGSL